MHPDDEDVSAYIAGLLSGEEPGPDAQSALLAMSVRIPVELAAHVIVMAESADKSRTEMVRLLLQAGVDAVLAKLSPPVSDDMREAAKERYQEMI